MNCVLKRNCIFIIDFFLLFDDETTHVEFMITKKHDCISLARSVYCMLGTHGNTLNNYLAPHQRYLVWENPYKSTVSVYIFLRALQRYVYYLLPWWRHQMEHVSAKLALCEGNSPVNYPHKVLWLGALRFSLTCVWTNSWVNNLDAGDLRRHCAHYNVTVILNTSPVLLPCLDPWIYLTQPCSWSWFGTKRTQP